jgi:hypothetical protein
MSACPRATALKEQSSLSKKGKKTVSLKLVMKKKLSFKSLLKKAAVSIKREAARKHQPVAISRNGKVLLVYPDKKEKVITAPVKRRKAS